MRRISAKNDKRKTAKATTPLRFKENIFLLYRDLISTFEVQSPHMLTRIFLAGYPPILGMVYVSRSCCLQTIKIPPNFKSEVGECLRHSKTAHRNIVFFIRWACPIYIHIKNRADEPVIAHLFIGSASYASGSLMTVIWHFFTRIKLSCLHFGQKSGKFLSSVSFRIIMRVLFLQIGHSIHWVSAITSPPILQNRSF